jgi:hypothetical protein
VTGRREEIAIELGIAVDIEIVIKRGETRERGDGGQRKKDIHTFVSLRSS